MGYELGQGMLTWSTMERITRRYGLVRFAATDSCGNGNEPFAMDEALLAHLEGRKGTLVAEVVETRKSTHAGDVALHIYPVTPARGERVILGVGRLFFCHDREADDTIEVGLLPDSPEETLPLSPGYGILTTHQVEPQAMQLSFDPANCYQKSWLDVPALYRAHEQSVRLVFEPND